MSSILDTYSKLSKLRDDGIELVELHHAFRLNGVVDLWKFNPTVYEISINKYTTFKNRTEAYNYAMKVLPIHEKRNAFKSTKKGRMTFQEYKHLNGPVVIESEYMHWENSLPKTSNDHLYFISNEFGEVKIGRSINPLQRLKELQTGSATTLKMLHVSLHKGIMEKQIHRCLEDIALSGEWFSHTERIDRFITYIKTCKTVAPPQDKPKHYKKIKLPSNTNKSKFTWQSTINYGIHKGKKLIDVPPDYLVWLFENKRARMFNKFIKENLSVLKGGGL